MKNKHVAAKRGAGSGVTGETGADMYTSLCIQQVTNEDLLCSGGNSTQDPVGPKTGRKPTEGGCMCTHD